MTALLWWTCGLLALVVAVGIVLWVVDWRRTERPAAMCIGCRNGNHDNHDAHGLRCSSYGCECKGVRR
jgi:hypothetical protein